LTEPGGGVAKKNATEHTIDQTDNNKPNKINKIKKKIKYTGKVLNIFTKSLIWAFFTCVIIFFLIMGGTYIKYAAEFDNAQPRNNSTKNIFYDKEGNVIYESFGTAEPHKIELDSVPGIVKNATLAAEDVDFYNHGAIDILGMARAAYLNYKSSDKTGLAKFSDLFSEENYIQGGGSTITQQLIKNVYLTSERSFNRKIKEIIYAFEMERKYSKDEIFSMYLNNVYYGEQSLGIANASKIYFGKDIDKLTLSEAAMLAGLPQAPSLFSPISGDFEAAKERQKYVLSQMYYAKMISLTEAQDAAKEYIYLASPQKDITLKYPYFVDYVKSQVKEKIGEEAYSLGGLKVYTTLNPKIQQTVEESAKKHLERLKYRDVSNAASVVIDNKTGEVVAMMGGVDYNTSKVNVATSLRQPGSSFKPIVYTAGLIEGYTASSLFWDSRVNFGGVPPYIPRNYDGGYRGHVTMRNSIANSLNIPAVEMTQLVGVDKVIETATKLGINIDTNRNYGLSIGLGSAEVKLLELARGYSTLAGGGNRPNLSVIDKIVDSQNAEIYLQPHMPDKVLDEKIAYIMTDILSDNKARRSVFGTYSDLQLGDRPVAAKTGTTDSYTDAWTMGYTVQYTVGVWAGNNDHSKMRYVPGIDGAAPIWNNIMEKIHSNLPKKNFEKPGGLTEMWVNPYTGKPAAYHGGINILEYYVPGTEPNKDTDFSYLDHFK